MRRFLLVGGVALFLLGMGCETIEPNDENAPRITSSPTLPTATQGIAYAFQFEATGGSSPYTWSLVEGYLPPGLNLTETGVLSGTPADTGHFSFSVQVRDQEGSEDQQSFSLTVVPMGSGGGGGGLNDPGFNSEICSGDWQSAVEVRGISLSSAIIQTLYNIVLNEGEQDVVLTDTYVRYTTVYQDRVYFVLSTGNLPARAIVVSACPVYNLGQIRRLDSEMVTAAEYYYRSNPSATDDDMIKLIGHYNGRIYYTQSLGNYARGYIDEYADEVEGYVQIPANASAVGLVGGAFRYDFEYLTLGMYSADIDGIQVVDRMSSRQPYWVFWTGNLSSGMHSFSIDFSWSYNPNQYRKYFFDAAGQAQSGPMTVTIGGQAQPTRLSLEISQLVLPE